MHRQMYTATSRALPLHTSEQGLVIVMDSEGYLDYIAKIHSHWSNANVTRKGHFFSLMFAAS